MHYAETLLVKSERRLEAVKFLQGLNHKEGKGTVAEISGCYGKACEISQVIKVGSCKKEPVERFNFKADDAHWIVNTCSWNRHRMVVLISRALMPHQMRISVLGIICKHCEFRPNCYSVDKYHYVPSGIVNL